MFTVAAGLYVLRIPNGPCKIGKSRDLERRFAEMQTHHPYDLEVVAWLPGRGYEEAAWHHCFDDYRIRGEWFTWAPVIQQAIDLAKAGGDWTDVAEPPPELLAEFSDVGRAQQVYRAFLKRWTGERERGVRETRLPPRANSPVTPKSPGPVPRHRREAEIARLKPEGIAR